MLRIENFGPRTAFACTVMIQVNITGANFMSLTVSSTPLQRTLFSYTGFSISYKKGDKNLQLFLLKETIAKKI